MARALCPHCHTSQEVAAPPPGTVARRACASCGQSFGVRAPAAVSPGSTVKITPPARATQAEEPPPASPPHGESPSRLGPYEVLGILGAGGMGVVYRGRDASLGREVALKTLRPELARDTEYRERFLREARAAAALSHPNVTQIYFIGEQEGMPFFAMEYLEGKSLAERLREEGKLPAEEAAKMIRQAASGLKAASERGIVHRDVKPSNLVLSSDGTLKVTDFGLAKQVLSDPGLTLAGEVLGSPSYMSPEQASGQDADLRSDIYSLGATFYELVTGRPPFDGPTPVSIILKHAREPLKNPRQLSPGLPYPLVTLIQKMLAKRPEDRPQNYDLLIGELDRLGSWPSSAAGSRRAASGDRFAAGRDAPLSPPASARPGAFWLLPLLLILILLGGWGLIRRVGEPAPPPDSPAVAPAQAAAPGSGTEILASTSEISPPSLGWRSERREALDPPLRAERLREAARASLQFVTNSHELTADGRLRIMGTVVNTGLGRASGIRIRILLSSASGQLLASTEVPLAPSLLGPRQTGAFEAFFPDPRQSVSIRTELNWNS